MHHDLIWYEESTPKIRDDRRNTESGPNCLNSVRIQSGSRNSSSKSAASCPIACQDILATSLVQISTTCSKSANIKLQQVWISQTWCNLMKPTGLTQLDNKLVGKVYNLHQACGCVGWFLLERRMGLHFNQLHCNTLNIICDLSTTSFWPTRKILV